MTDPNSLQRALNDFYRTMDSLRFQGVSQVAELARLEILVSKYPDHARKMLDEHDQVRTGNGS